MLYYPQIENIALDSRCLTPPLTLTVAFCTATHTLNSQTTRTHTHNSQLHNYNSQLIVYLLILGYRVIPYAGDFNGSRSSTRRIFDATQASLER